MRQKAEYCRITEQINDVRSIKEELDSSWMLCVRKLQRVEQVLGVESIDYI